MGVEGHAYCCVECQICLNIPEQALRDGKGRQWGKDGLGEEFKLVGHQVLGT